MLDALAFIIWNVGTRPPLRLLADIRHGLRDRRALLVGGACALVGFIFIMAATVALLPAIVDKPHDLTLAELVTFLVALGIELLVGDDVRALADLGRKR